MCVLGGGGGGGEGVKGVDTSHPPHLKKVFPTGILSPFLSALHASCLKTYLILAKHVCSPDER